jgi:hypothetical protein
VGDLLELYRWREKYIQTEGERGRVDEMGERGRKGRVCVRERECEEKGQEGERWDRRES